MKKYRIILSVLLIGLGGIFLAAKKYMKPKTQITDKINYVSLGDSYTIATGINTTEGYPHQLTDALNKLGKATTLITNPSQNGFSTQNLIDAELPVLEKTDANFVTILIGVNDWVRKVELGTFEKNYQTIIDAVQKKLGANKNKIILITIPDFGVTPTGKNYSGGRDISKGIADFNTVIKRLGTKNKLPVADIFATTQLMKDNPSLTAPDGLHPNKKEYGEWTKIILEIAKKIL